MEVKYIKQEFAWGSTESNNKCLTKHRKACFKEYPHFGQEYEKQMY